MKILGCMIFFLAITLLSADLRAETADILYKEGAELEKSGKRDFATFKYLAIIRNYPNSKWVDDSLFKMGEYHYLNNDYYNARLSFEDLIKQYPKSEFIADCKKYLEKISKKYKKINLETEILKILSSVESLKVGEKWDDLADECEKLSLIPDLSDEYRTKLVEYYIICGDAYLNEKALEKAKAVFEKVIRIAPDNQEVVNKLYEVNHLLK